MKRRRKQPKPWTKLAQRELFNGVGISGLAWFKKRCGGRTLNAIYHKLSREYANGGFTRGAFTIHELETLTGYSESQIRRAGSALNQKWKRLGPRGAHIITEEQRDEIVAWLGHDYWSKPHRLYGCLWCSTMRRSHRSGGLCVRCHAKYQRACRKRGFGGSIRDQKLLIQGITLRGSQSKEQAVFLAKANKRLVSGLALDESHLDWLAMLIP